MSNALPQSTHIAIVGGGMVGLSLALLLAKQCPNLDICLLEAVAAPAPKKAVNGHALKQAASSMPPSFDARSTALSESSKKIFTRLGLWLELERYGCAIENIQVSDKGHPGAVRMAASESQVEYLGYVVENRHLGRQLMAAAQAQPRISICAPVKADQLIPVAAGMTVRVGEQHLKTTLTVVADGADSASLQQLGIHTRKQDYGQTAIITNIALANDHKGIAYERFTEDGPIALLPLPDVDGQHRAALVWTLAPQRAEQLMTVAEDEFLAELHQSFGYRAGELIACGQRSCYPLSLMVAEEQIRRNLVVVGNAAHFLHPVAGQGFNLALRDVARLADILACAPPTEMGNLDVLEQYLRAQQQDQQHTIALSDGLPKIFGLNSLPSIVLRNGGLLALDLIGPARNAFSRRGAGLAFPAARDWEQRR